MKAGVGLKKLIDSYHATGDYNKVAQRGVISNKKAKQLIEDILESSGQETEISREHYNALVKFYKQQKKQVQLV